MDRAEESKAEVRIILDSIRAWAGADVRELLPDLRTIDKKFAELDDDDIEELRQELLEAGQLASQIAWPDALSDSFDFLIIDASGRYLYREADKYDRPEWSIGRFDQDLIGNGPSTPDERA